MRFSPECKRTFTSEYDFNIRLVHSYQRAKLMQNRPLKSDVEMNLKGTSQWDSFKLEIRGGSGLFGTQNVLNEAKIKYFPKEQINVLFNINGSFTSPISEAEPILH